MARGLREYGASSDMEDEAFDMALREKRGAILAGNPDAIAWLEEHGAKSLL